MGSRANQILALLICLLLCFGTLAKESKERPTLIHSSHQMQILTKPSSLEKAVKVENKHKRILLLTSEKDVVTPITTVPVINPSTPSNPTTTTPVYNPFPTPYSPSTPMTTPVTTPTYTTPTYTTPTYTTPTMVTPTTSSGHSWCVASQTASQTALQVALDYACGFGGADCSAIQSGGSCYNPDTIRDHASYAFNDYYQKNPVANSCDFGGTA